MYIYCGQSSVPYLEKTRKESNDRHYPEMLFEVTLMDPDARYEVTTLSANAISKVSLF